MTEENKTKSLWLPKMDDLCVLAALTLGDGCITPKGRFVVTHGMQQQDYADWKAKIISNILQQEVKALPTRNCVQIQFCRKFFKDMYYKWYPNKRKDLVAILKSTKNAKRTAAIWIMDDGNVLPSVSSKTKKVYSAAIQIFAFSTLEEGLEILKWFKHNFGVEGNLHYMDREKSGRKSGYKVKFSASESRKLYQIIKSEIPDIPSMKFKFRHIEYNVSTSPQLPVKEEQIV